MAFRSGTRELSMQKPDIYQMSDAGKRIEVAGAWQLKAGHKLGFIVPNYDHGRELVIDPSFSPSLGSFPLFSYLGGTGSTSGAGIAVNPVITSKGPPEVTDTYVYVVGTTVSTASSFPNGGTTSEPGKEVIDTTGNNVFVSEYESISGELQWSTFLGGAIGPSEGNAIAVSSGGNAFITGQTLAVGTGNHFPTTDGSTGCNGTETSCSAVFVTELSTDGASLEYSVFSDGLSGNAITLDPAGNAYVTGSTESGAFPTINVLQPIYGGGTTDAFVAELNSSGGLLWWTYLGGGGTEIGLGIALDTATPPNVYATGTTFSGAIDSGTTPFPTTTNPIQPANRGAGSNAFVAELNNTGTQLIFSTYLGGSGGGDGGNAIAVDASGNVIVTGATNSTDFPTLNALQPAYPTGASGVAFISKLAPSGANLVYSTFLGGLEEAGYGVAVDANGNTYIAGSIATPATTSFPSTIGSIDPNLLSLSTNSIEPQCGDYNPPGDDTTCASGFVTAINPSGNQFLYFTYIGGDGKTGASAIALDSSSGCSLVSSDAFGSPCAYVTGSTTSSDMPSTDPTSFPTSGLSPAEAQAAFVAQIPSIVEPVCPKSLTEIGLVVTVSLECTSNFNSGAGSVNWGDGKAFSSITLTGLNNPSTLATHNYGVDPTVAPSASMTNSGGNGTTGASVFPTINVQALAVNVTAPSCGNYTNPALACPFSGPTASATCSTIESTQAPATFSPSATVCGDVTYNFSSNSLVPNNNVCWYVNSILNGTAQTGTISGGTYTAPPGLTTQLQNIQITAASVDDPGFLPTSPTQPPCSGTPTTLSNSLTFTVLPQLMLSPSTLAPVTAGTTSTPDTVNANLDVTWQVSGTEVAGAGPGCSGTSCGAYSTTATSITYAPPATLPNATPLAVTLAATTTADQTVSDSITVKPPSVTLSSITPSSQTTTAQPSPTTVTFSAPVTGPTDTTVTWKLLLSGNPCAPQCGTIASTGNTLSSESSSGTATATYTTPTSPIGSASEMVTVAATASAAPASGDTVDPTLTSQTQTTTLTLNNPSLTPATASVQAGNTTGVTLTTVPSLNVTWQLSGTGGPGCSGMPSCGTVSATGTVGTYIYTPPAALPTSAPLVVTLTATTVALPAFTFSSLITVTPLPVGVSISPASPPPVIVTLPPVQQIPFTATVTGPSNLAVTWSISGGGCGGNPCGTVNATTGVYTAPSVKMPNATATDTVTATSQADATKFASVQVNLYNPATVTLTPGTTSVQASSAAFTVSAQLSPVVPSQNQNVTWQLSGAGCGGNPCGSINTPGPSASTIYTPPAKLPSSASINDTVTATSVAEPTQSGQSVITVTPLPISVSISPTSATVTTTLSNPIQFTATVTGPSNTAVTWSISGTGCSGAPCGTLSATGLYTPPSATITNFGSVDTVTATSKADPTKSASAQITVNNPVTISIAPSVVGGQFSIEVGQSQAFSATASGQLNLGVQWTLAGSTGCSGGPCGTISPTGTYTAPTTLASWQTDTITATALLANGTPTTATASIKAVIFLPPSASTPASVTVAPGGKAQYTVTLNAGTGDPLYGEKLSCLTLPNGTACAFSVNPLPVGGTSIMVQVTTTGNGVSSLQKGNGAMLAGLVPLVGLFLFGLRGAKFRKRLIRYFALVVLSILISSGLIACGTSGSFGTNQFPNELATPPGSWAISLMGTSNVPAGQITPTPSVVTTLPLVVN